VLVNAKHIRDLSDVENQRVFSLRDSESAVVPTQAVAVVTNIGQRVDPFFTAYVAMSPSRLAVQRKPLFGRYPSRHPLLTASTKPQCLPRSSPGFRGVAA